MRLETVYICVGDMEKSLCFYKQLLQREPSYCNEDRWVVFDCGYPLALYNKKYDEKLIEETSEGCFNQEYIDDFFTDDSCQKNNIVVFNFVVDDLNKEYQRLKKLNIGEVSKIMYVHIHMPYYYFQITDPDGNVLEITGEYKKKTD